MATQAHSDIFWPCLIRAGSLAHAVAQAAQWKAAGGDGVIVPVPWHGAGGSSLVPLDADAGERSGAPVRGEIAEACRQLAGYGLSCHLELALDRVDRHAVAGTASPGWLQPEPMDPYTDPRIARADLHTRRVLHRPPAIVFTTLSIWRPTSGACCFPMSARQAVT